MRQAKEPPSNNTNERVIYALMIPKSKDYFIGHCRKDLLKSVFQKHCYGERYQTNDVINEVKEDNLHPCLFRLEEVSCSKKEAFHYVVAWTRIFRDSGYNNLNHGNVSDYIDNLLEESLEIYQQRKDINISQLITCNECLVAYYNKKRCPFFIGENSNFVWENNSERSKQVKTYVSTEEYKQIQKNAKACGKTVSAYIRDTALNMVMIKIDDSNSSVRTEAICGAYEAICQLVYRMNRIDQFVPADLEYILEKAKEMIRIENICLNEQRKNHDAIQTSISKTVENTVQKIINERKDFL